MTTTPEPETTTPTPEIPTLLDPEDVRRALKLSSKRAARELIAREMEHVVVARTPMTSTVWLAQWLQDKRRSPRQPAPRVPQADAAPPPKPIAINSRRASRHRPAMPPPRSRRKAA